MIKILLVNRDGWRKPLEEASCRELREAAIHVGLMAMLWPLGRTILAGESIYRRCKRFSRGWL